MSIKLNAQSGGSVSLDAPTQTDSSADVQLILPTNDGNANQIITTDGSGTLSFGAPTLQVVQTTKTDRQTITATDSQPVDIGNFNASITPTSSSSKILIHFSLHIGTKGYFFLNLLRGTTNIAQAPQDGSNRVACTASVNQTLDYEDIPFNFMFLDNNPGSTSSITYKVNGYLSQYANNTASGPYVAHINRPPTYDDQDYTGNPMSTLTLIEVQG